jgi:hypothetical protein
VEELLVDVMLVVVSTESVCGRGWLVLVGCLVVDQAGGVKLMAAGDLAHG